MLILDIRLDDGVIIGSPHKPIGKIQLLKSRKGVARIGIDLPGYIEINREQVAKRKAQEPEERGSDNEPETSNDKVQ